jgi:hypothetical protein
MSDPRYRKDNTFQDEKVFWITLALGILIGYGLFAWLS